MFELHSGLIWWTLINFGVLLVVLKKFAWKPILAALEQRESGIKDSLAQAEAAREAAAKSKAECQAILDESRREAQTIVDDARKRAEQEYATILIQAKSDAAAQLDRAQQDIQRERDQALESLRAEVANLSVLVAGKVIGKSLDTDSHKQLIDDAMTEFRQQT
jgi:F-type H+-transporting ATPase subunit b